jgi:DNA-binding NtrC family response regulator
MPARIFLVHNEAEPRELALNALAAAGHVAVGFDDPIKVLDALEANSDICVLVVTRVDFGAGKLNGVALARMVRVKRPGSKCVFAVRPEDHHLAKREGEILRLPVDPSALVEIVDRLLAAA